MKKLKKTISLIIAVAASIAAFTGCNNASGDKTDLGLLNDGVLNVGSEIGYPPFEFWADDGSTPMGLDIDLATAVAEYLGLEVKFSDTAWDAIFSGLDIDKYDCVISAVTITGERKEMMDFSDYYIENWQAIVVKKGDTPITSMAELDGLKVAYQGETTSDEYINDLIDTGVISCETFEYDKVMNCYDDLKLGRVDAVLSDSLVADGYIARESDLFEITWNQSNDEGEEPELFGIAVKKGNDKLLAAVNEALDELEKNGNLQEIINAWF